MSELIIDSDKRLSKDAEQYIIDVEQKLAELLVIEKHLKEELKTRMEESGVLGISTERLQIAYIQPTTKESIDSKRLKEENLDLYNKYCKISQVKGYVKVKVLSDD